MAPAISINTDLKTFFVLIREIRIKKTTDFSDITDGIRLLKTYAKALRN